ncbi:MAG: lytic transglycosylase domain-containing protein [Thermoanaerobaculia bacterium]
MSSGTALRRAALMLAAGLISVAAATAEIRVVQRPDGSTYVYNVPNRRRTLGIAPAARLSPPASGEIDALVAKHARGASLDAELVRAVIQVESAFDPRARSHKGAMGLMQLMPATAAMYSVADPYDPSQNVAAGTRYLRTMLDSFGNLEVALAAYNAGPAAVKRFGGVPPYPETRDYIEKVMRVYRNDDRYSLAGSTNLRRGRKTYLRRDGAGRLIMTTTPPGG